MKNYVIFFLLFTYLALAQDISIKGTIVDARTGKPLAGANISVDAKPNTGTASGAKGEFTLQDVSSQSDDIIISYVGYEKKIIKASLLINKDQVIEMEPLVIPSQTVLVKGSIGTAGVTPLAFGKITRKEIDDKYTLQDIPQFLSELPSTTFYSESGNGVGYNYISIRGFDQRRISVAVNGIPQNEPEDQNVYWLDFPDLLASTEMIQVQRGSGSGVFGYPAIGGSINIITSAFSNKPRFDFSASLGSYNTRRYSASFASGLIDNKYSIYAKFSRILSSGYRNLSYSKFSSYHLSAVRYDDNLTTQVNLYGGPVEDGLAYTGLPKFAVKDKNLRKANYSSWEADNNQISYAADRRPSEIENFSQPHYELLNELKINSNVTLNSAIFLITGSGFFDYDGSWADTSYFRLTNANGFNPTGNPGNALIRAQVDNVQYGWIPRVSIKHDGGEFLIGAEFRSHRSKHWGSIKYADNIPAGVSEDFKYYYYEGSKDIANAFVHESYQLTQSLNLLAELQLAYHSYGIKNERYLNTKFDVDGLYLNPRAGINYKISEKHNIFFSFARVTKEPRLKNYYDAAESSGGAVPQFEQNTDGSYNFDKPLVKPEVMNDFEIGSSYNQKNLSLSLNLFYMIFEDEIVKNGKLDRFGQPITGNVDRTNHSGIEISANYRVANGLEAFANATYSRNEIKDGKFFIDAVNSIELDGNRISGFPDFLANAGIGYHNYGLNLRLTARYVGWFYSDNYDNKLGEYLTKYPGFVAYNDNKNDAYFVADFAGSYEINMFGSLNSSKIFFQVNNIFDRLYSANAVGAEFFPAAERNFLAGVQLGL
jgi:iron complex outermembrane receptor protein